MLDPLLGFEHRLGVQPATPYTPVALLREHPRAFEHTQVLADRGERDVKGLGQLPDGDAPSVVGLAGKLTGGRLLVVYHLSRVLVTSDSGRAQFATLTPIGLITMFGPETPVAFGARTPRNEILWTGIACSPCVSAYNDRQSACRDNVCMPRDDVDRVF